MVVTVIDSDNLHTATTVRRISSNNEMNPNSANDLYNLNSATTAMAPGSMMVGGGGGGSNNTTYLSSGMPSQSQQQQQQQQQNSTAASGGTSNNTTTNSLFLQLQAQQQRMQGPGGQLQQQYANNGYGNNNTDVGGTTSISTTLPLNDNGSSNNNNNIASAASAAGAAGGGGAPSDFQTYRSSIASLASNNTSHTSSNNNNSNNSNDNDDDTSSDAYRRVSKESLASHESLSDMLNSNSLNSVVVTTGISSNLSNIGSYSAGLAAAASSGGVGAGGGANNGGMDPQQQQQNLLNLLQRQQMQMGSMGVNTHTTMMQGISNSGGGIGGGVVGGGNDMNMNLFMNYMGTAQGGGGGVGGGGLDGGTTNNLMNNASEQSQQQQPTQTETNFQALSIPTKKSRHKQTFAMKLMNILSIKECQSSIRWMPNGRAFCIVDPKLLVEKVLPVYFNEAKYASFTRKLNRWGFKHYSLPVTNASDPSSNNTTSNNTTAAAPDKEMSIYSHDKFRRDDPTLCHTMDGGHRRRNARKDEERTRQLYASLQPDMVEMLRSQGGAGSSMGMGMDATQSSIQAMQLKLLQQQQQLQQQKNQMMAMMNNPLYSQGMMGMNMMGGGGTGGGVGGGADVVNNANAAAMVGMRRTSLGFMPYLPTSNVGRRDSMGSVFSGVGITTDNDGKIESTFDDVGGDGVGAANGAAGGRGGTGWRCC